MMYTKHTVQYAAVGVFLCFQLYLSILYINCLDTVPYKYKKSQSGVISNFEINKFISYTIFFLNLWIYFRKEKFEREKLMNKKKNKKKKSRGFKAIVKSRFDSNAEGSWYVISLFSRFDDKTVTKKKKRKEKIKSLISNNWILFPFMDNKVCVLPSSRIPFNFPYFTHFL